MAAIRLVAGALAVAGIAATAGAFSTAHAQASGTLQASVIVLDDLVSRVVTAHLETHFSGRDGKMRRPLPLEADAQVGVTASLIELGPDGPTRRLRVEIAYLH